MTTTAALTATRTARMREHGTELTYLLQNKIGSTAMITSGLDDAISALESGRDEGGQELRDLVEHLDLLDEEADHKITVIAEYADDLFADDYAERYWEGQQGDAWSGGFADNH